jgi:hypothetical protein
MNLNMAYFYSLFIVLLIHVNQWAAMDTGLCFELHLYSLLFNNDT